MRIGFGPDVKTQGLKVCDACVFYRCTGDGGNNIMSGFGCYEDFDKFCQNVPADVKESVKTNIKASYHFDKDYLVVTCSMDDDCSSEEYRRYYDVHNFDKIETNSFSDGTCEHGIAEASFSPSLQIIHLNLLFGIIISEFIFYHFF
uniref:Sodefrin-like factor n=1 Tax=Panagrolaimus superbus TaxID=310955 RepID=A0A914YK00_9BILA